METESRISRLCANRSQIDEPDTAGHGFDELAAGYDDTFTDTALGSWLREVVWARTSVSFPAGGRILEIGCGTGEDALHLAGRGYSVLATDASPRMVAIAADKAKRAGCAERIEFLCVPMEQLGPALLDKCFDAVFSNFGAINCASDLQSLAVEVARLLRPGAPLLWVVMGRHVPWEWVWFLGRRDAARAFRRLRRQGVIWRGMRIQYPTPQALSEMLQPEFMDIRWRALGALLPPTYAAGWINRRPRILASLARVEGALSRIPLMALLADHFIVEARRKNEGDA